MQHSPTTRGGEVRTAFEERTHGDKKLDGAKLLTAGQPLHHDGLSDRARPRLNLKMPDGLDEGVTGLRQAKRALEAGSCWVIHIRARRKAPRGIVNAPRGSGPGFDVDQDDIAHRTETVEVIHRKNTEP